MEPLIFFLVLSLPGIADQVMDPSNSFIIGRQELRNLECTRMSQQRAHELYPGKVPEPSPRATTFAKIDALVCHSRVMKPGERPPRDEVILSNLSESVGQIVEGAKTLGTKDTVWLVDAFYPDAHVASKIANAARISLVERKHQVSDRVPLLAAGDLVVLRDLPAAKAYPLACSRYFAEASLAENDAFLGVMLLDARETQLHAGVCMGGVWRWLR